MDADEVRDYLARIDWNRQFDPATLRRANAYLQDNHLESLRFEVDRRGIARLRALVRGSSEAIYEPWIEFRPQREGFSLLGSCDCPVSGPCKHQALVLLYAQMHPPAAWPEDHPQPPAPAAHPPSSEQLDALPGWLREAMAGQISSASASTLSAWDSWLARLSQAPVDDTALDNTERRFGLVLRDLDGTLAVLPAFLRPGRGRTTGWVDPRPLELLTAGPSPAPPGGWSEEDAIALGALLSSITPEARRTDPVPVGSAHAEAALRRLLPRHPVYWERGSVPLEFGPELPMQLHWEDQPDGTQRLSARVAADDGEPTRLLKGHGLWYVQPEARRFGPVAGDSRLFDLVMSAPQLQPEDVTEVQQRFKRVAALPVAMPRPRTLRTIRPTPVPVLRMSVMEVDPWGRSPQRAPLRLGVATLLFDYDGHLLPPSAGEPQKRVAQGDEVLQIERDASREQRFEARLEALDLIDAVVWGYDMHLRSKTFAPNQYLLRPDARKPPLTPEAWTLTLSELTASGYRIEYERDFPRDDVVEIDDWHAELEDSGSAWFDVSLGIDVEGQRIDLLPILRRILDDPDFPMRKPDDEPDDAAWRVRIDENRSVRLPMARLRAMLEPLLEWLIGSDDGLRLHRTQAETLRRLGDEAQLPWRGGDRLRAHLDHLRSAKIQADTPPGFRAELRPYQRDGLAWLDFLSEAGLGGVLADDMGLGKTVQVLAHLVSEKARGRLDLPALVVAPTSLVGNWRDEAARFAPDLSVLVLHGADRAVRYEAIADADLVITTYPLLPRDRDDLCKQQFSLLVMDEAQAIKNARSQAAQVVREIPARRRLAMTGTPLENHLGELWAQFDAVEPGLLGSETSFTRTYRTPIEKHGDSDRQQRLKRRIAALLLRRRKEDVLTELPPKTEIVHSLELTGSQRQLYETLRLAQHERVRESIAQRGLAQSGIVVIDALLKLRQACCDPRLVKLDSARKVKESAKLDALLELLDGLCDEGRRVLVFSQFTQMLALIQQALDQRGASYLTLTGDTPSGARAELVRSFQEGDVPVFLISLKAGGVGLNLTAADTVIHYDPWWNPAVESQATDRAHRMGQDKPVFVYKLICAGTVEEKIQAMQERKAELARAVLEGGSTAALRFDEADLAELFGPL
ncbi:DEAD/DEAH box helicase [Xanthomonadaceae bacterium JHOS43]|nr:DEAD/DEAH box helicase [Xanthomonadaceae bacterium JHOS43]MCX7564272.1 DEAD/DEAH box helicase [Xanthomonadaceae bacterium XH05]